MNNKQQQTNKNTYRLWGYHKIAINFIAFIIITNYPNNTYMY